MFFHRAFGAPNVQKSFWRRYKDEARYQSSPFPFPPKRMSLFDKLHGDFIGLLSIVGAVWLIFAFIRYALS